MRVAVPLPACRGYVGRQRRARTGRGEDPVVREGMHAAHESSSFEREERRKPALTRAAPAASRSSARFMAQAEQDEAIVMPRPLMVGKDDTKHLSREGTGGAGAAQTATREALGEEAPTRQTTFRLSLPYLDGHR